MKDIYVVAAIIVKDKKILCTQRGPGGPAAHKWEFPGGKIEAGETPEEALVREIQEELGARVKIEGFFMTIEHTYHGDDGFNLMMDNYLCRLQEDFELLEHEASVWLGQEALIRLDWADADWPIVYKLAEMNL